MRDGATRDEAGSFEAYYDRHIAPELSALEAARRSRMRLVISLAGVGLPLLALVIADAAFGDDALARAASSMFGLQGTIGATVLFLLAFALLVGAVFAYQGIYDRHKRVLVGGACRYVGLDYALKGFALDVGPFTPLLPIFASHKLEDRIAGVYRGVSFELCEGSFFRRKQRHRALLIRSSFDRAFAGETVVARDSGLVGNFLERARQRGEVTRLEGVSFEEQFEVYTTDPVEARVLLTPRFMEQIVELGERLHNRRGIALAFSGGELLLAIRLADHARRFEIGHAFTPITDGCKRAQAIIAELDLIASIIDTLDLARRGGRRPRPKGD